EWHARGELDRRPRLHAHVSDCTRDRGNLGQWMHRLLKQDIDRRLKHPVAKLPRGQLTQRHVVDAADMTGASQRSAIHHTLQACKCRVMQKVLIDAEPCAALYCRSQQFSTVLAALGHRFFEQHRLADSQHRQCSTSMEVRRHPDVDAPPQNRARLSAALRLGSTTAATRAFGTDCSTSACTRAMKPAPTSAT